MQISAKFKDPLNLGYAIKMKSTNQPINQRANQKARICPTNQGTEQTYQKTNQTHSFLWRQKMETWRRLKAF